MRYLLIVALLSCVAVAAWHSVDGAQEQPPLWTLEGELKEHPKYLYRYYVTFGDGQKCALYGPKENRDPKPLAGIKPGTRVRVQGTLGTSYFAGGNKTNPSPFGPTWVLYMEVRGAQTINE